MDEGGIDAIKYRLQQAFDTAADFNGETPLNRAPETAASRCGHFLDRLNGRYETTLRGLNDISVGPYIDRMSRFLGIAPQVPLPQTE